MMGEPHADTSQHSRAALCAAAGPDPAQTSIMPSPVQATCPSSRPAPDANVEEINAASSRSGGSGS